MKQNIALGIMKHNIALRRMKEKIAPRHCMNQIFFSYLPVNDKNK